ncbi:oligosaccharide flippase family protein [Tropicimonas sp. IMCC6043]|uniref:oligosaccharide flippase family protein n=1 Tax=Tropicimonas sp. IMCC6043 TaxID=2510645 RepID=UPI00101CCA8B|nr:oligosaccharide flippase family protein [Tropicimonas sp. IMCC6043]RYH11002.1 polysaccharide biosynthesis protein [Tropicimonas sp. IMCC6043]
MKRLLRPFTGSNPAALAMRGSFWTSVDFGGGNLLRLASNLILTRLLFPEAFGLMAVVQIFLAGLQMFSDTGMQQAIIQNARGDDPDYLDTAWTVTILRGFLLWLATWLLAGPVAHAYSEPVLAEMMPWMGLSLVIQAFRPMAVVTAARHLQLGRITLINLAVSLAQIIVACVLAFLLHSVWALVIAGIFRSLLAVAAYWLLLPGARNRLRLERPALGSLFHFGKYIFLGSIAAFLIRQSDRAVLGLHVSMADLGIYNIGLFMAMMPRDFASALQSRVIFPLYRMKPMSESAHNRSRIFRARRLVAAVMVGVSLLLAAVGPWLIGLLYDARYQAAGGMMVLFALAIIPQVTLTTTGQMLVALGDTRRMLQIQLLVSALQILILYFGVRSFGVAGAILAPGLACILAHPLRVSYARRYECWDPLQDIGLTALGLIAASAICAWHVETVQSVFN